ncbi:hypothetical protein [Rahnella sp. ChDrAdgB13]|uniref:hypothetical protein n=1 Tax=Rahnella sp. ChDrAdgB13 TaxID=1850581 RepID=UPI001AD884C9|nr:hypothetical protein [Rahnella sp. ChDrAdgB13]
MILLNFICTVSAFLTGVSGRLFPRTLLTEWLDWFTGDVRLLRRLISELKLATTCHQHPFGADAEKFVEQIVYNTAYELGYRSFYGLYERWPENVVHQLVVNSFPIGAAHWDLVMASGYLDAHNLETEETIFLLSY